MHGQIYLQGVLKYVFFSKILRNVFRPPSVFSFIGFHARAVRWQVEQQRLTELAEKNHNILRKNTIFNEHPVDKHSESNN